MFGITIDVGPTFYSALFPTHDSDLRHGLLTFHVKVLRKAFAIPI